jgi:hypothetical protein
VHRLTDAEAGVDEHQAVGAFDEQAVTDEVAAADERAAQGAKGAAVEVMDADALA